MLAWRLVRNSLARDRVADQRRPFDFGGERGRAHDPRHREPRSPDVDLDGTAGDLQAPHAEPPRGHVAEHDERETLVRLVEEAPREHPSAERREQLRFACLHAQSARFRLFDELAASHGPFRDDCSPPPRAARSGGGEQRAPPIPAATPFRRRSSARASPSGGSSRARSARPRAPLCSNPRSRARRPSPRSRSPPRAPTGPRAAGACAGRGLRPAGRPRQATGFRGIGCGAPAVCPEAERVRRRLRRPRTAASRALLVDQASVAQLHAPRQGRRDLAVVGDHEDRRPLRVQRVAAARGSRARCACRGCPSARRRARSRAS